MNVVLTDGTTKRYRMTLKMLGMGSNDTWHNVDYEHIIISLEKYYPELKGNINRAYL